MDGRAWLSREEREGRPVCRSGLQDVNQEAFMELVFVLNEGMPECMPCTLDISYLVCFFISS